MPPITHGFCKIHRIAYNRDYDSVCPQCLLSRQPITDQLLDYDSTIQKPLDATGKPLDAKTLLPVA